jgi:amino acid adenylation domain-containing protein
MLVHDFLINSAVRFPEKTALVCGAHKYTYAQLDKLTDRLAHGLIERGVRRGDRVVVYLGNSLESVLSIFAVLKAGAVFVPVNPTAKRDKVLFILRRCGACAIFMDARSAKLVHEIRTDVPSVRTFVLSGNDADAIAAREACCTLDSLVNSVAALPPPRINIDLDLACLIFTSGSTGEPKGVTCGHDNVVFAAGSIISYLKGSPDDVVINVLPLSFDYGLYQLLMTFRLGATLVLETSFAFPATFLKRMEEERVTGLPGVPTIFAMLVQMDLSQYDLSGLRYLTNTGAALAPAHIEILRQKFPKAALYSMYGLTETKRTLYLPPDQLDKRPGSVGIAIPGTEVWLEDASGKRLGPGETGELVIRGRHVMRGYWEDAEATAARYRPGEIPGDRVCVSGDIFRTDSEGYFYFVGRKDDIIKSRGEKVAPKEVENVLYALKGVSHAAVIGVPDAIMGQAIKAVLVCNDATITETRVLAHCRANLEDFMVPKYVEFRTEMPLTQSGKIKKSALDPCAA